VNKASATQPPAKKARTSSSIPISPEPTNNLPLSQLLRQAIMEKEETTNGEYEVDMTRYFKLLSSDVDETIFEEE
jgi:hypothetical protein